MSYFSHIINLKTKYLNYPGIFVSFVLLLATFHFYGNSGFVEVSGRSLFVWLYQAWTSDAPGIDYSHGPLVLLFAIYLTYKRKDLFLQQSRQVYIPALALLIGSLLVHIAGLKIQYTSISAASLLLAIISLVAYYFGPRALPAIWFPVGFILFAVPMPLIANASFPLRLMASQITEILLNGLALPVIRQGTSLATINPPVFAAEIADPCSGIRSLMALLALTAGWAYLSKQPLVLKWIFFLSAIPVAIIANIFRITSVMLMSRVLNTETTLTFYHDYSGYLVFIVAVIIILFEASCFEKLAKKMQSKTEES